MGMEIPWSGGGGGGGSQRPKNVNKSMGFYWNFQRDGGVLIKYPSHGRCMDMELHIQHFKMSEYCHSLTYSMGSVWRHIWIPEIDNKQRGWQCQLDHWNYKMIHCNQRKIKVNNSSTTTFVRIRQIKAKTARQRFTLQTWLEPYLNVIKITAGISMISVQAMNLIIPCWFISTFSMALRADLHIK